MIPASVPGVMNKLQILSLEIERMPKEPTAGIFRYVQSALSFGLYDFYMI